MWFYAVDKTVKKNISILVDVSYLVNENDDPCVYPQIAQYANQNKGENIKRVLVQFEVDVPLVDFGADCRAESVSLEDG